MSIFKNRSQLEFYILALEKWTTVAKTSGMVETPLADIVLARGVEQAPELCREMSKHFDDSLKGNSKGIEKTVTWLRAELGKDKQEGMVEALNQLQEGVQEEMKRKIPVFFTTEVEVVDFVNCDKFSIANP